MFTGLVEEKGSVVSVRRTVEGVRLVISASAIPPRLEMGASVSVDGVCLTAVELAADRFAVDVTPETLSRTTLGGLRTGRPVNLELPLRVGDVMGGHFVQGHVDTTGKVTSNRKSADGRELAVAYPVGYDPLVVEKGSVAVSGVSLTVAGRSRGALRIALIPHTCERTTLGGLSAGQKVNLEFDYLAKLVLSAVESRGL